MSQCTDDQHFFAREVAICDCGKKESFLISPDGREWKRVIEWRSVLEAQHASERVFEIKRRAEAFAKLALIPVIGPVLAAMAMGYWQGSDKANQNIK